ncbi:hypothetical protein BC941DRAFT_407565 [Chlamydoabsidia padenii]|nr:hypothetical protein BC941DRAFT_407565 [Chlamydoabsidia padenii]
MSMSWSGSTLYRRIWINHLLQSQHSRSVHLATKQAQQTSSHINNYQPPPSFLTPMSQPSLATPRPPVLNTKTTTYSKRNMEKAIVQQIKTGLVDDLHYILGDVYRAGYTPNITTYNHIIKGLARQFHHRQRQLEAHALLKDMERRGVSPNSQTFMQILLGYIVHTKTIATTTPPSSVDTSQMIQLLFDRLLCCERQRGYKRTHHKVKKLVEMMAGVGHASILPVMITSMKVGILFDVSIWNTALAGCIRGGYLDAGEQLLNLMRQSRQWQQQNQGLVIIPNVTSYHIVISGYLGCHGGVADMDRAIELLHIMTEDGLAADYRIYQDFLCAHTTLTITDKSANLGDHMRQQKDDRLFTVQRLWQAMMTTMTDGQKVGDDVLTKLLDYYLQNEAYSSMEQVYWDLRQRDNTFSRRIAIYFYKAITGFARKQHLLSGIAMFYDLLTDGHGANHSATCSLIRACILRGQLDMAQQILDVIEETSQQPAAGNHYATMVQAYIQQGQLESAKAMFSKAQQSHSSRSSESLGLLKACQAMIQGYFRVRELKKVESLLEQYNTSLQLEGISNDNNGMMDQRLINTMMEGLGLVGDMDRLDDFLDREDVDINTLESMMILIQSRLYQGNVTGAENDLKKGLEHYDAKSLQPSIQAVLTGMALDGNVASCEKWVDLLSTNGLMNGASYEALLVCYGKSGDTAKLVQLHDQLVRQGVQLEQGLENKMNNEWLENQNMCI